MSFAAIGQLDESTLFRLAANPNSPAALAERIAFVAATADVERPRLLADELPRFELTGRITVSRLALWAGLEIGLFFAKKIDAIIGPVAHRVARAVRAFELGLGLSPEGVGNRQLPELRIEVFELTTGLTGGSNSQGDGQLQTGGPGSWSDAGIADVTLYSPTEMEGDTGDKAIAYFHWPSKSWILLQIVCAVA